MICIGLVLQGLSGCDENGRAQAVPGQSFPLAVLTQLQRISRDEIDIENKILLINFWATWCAPCREEMPDLQKLSDSLDPSRFAVIGVSVDEDSNLIREFILQHNIQFPNLQDDNYRLASELLGIKTYPVTFIVSSRGIIKRRINEVIPWDNNTMQQFLEFDSGASATTLSNRKKSG
jgi:thiol-disulfide isomerase/thioredoxin